MSHQSCANCMYYWPEPKACRRHAPQAIVVPVPANIVAAPMNALILWPPSRDDRWCGEWKARVDVAAATEN